MIKKAFTMAEVLITITILGIIAALIIPSVIDNTQQSQYKTGLKKAVSVLNSAITMSIALDNDSPYTNQDLYGFLQNHMSVLKSTTRLPWTAKTYYGDKMVFDGIQNAAFYTVDGIRYEFDDNRTVTQNGGQKDLLKLHNSEYSACFAVAETALVGTAYGKDTFFGCGGCGSLGLEHNPNNTTKVPCAILVDVNGDRKPTPQFVYDSADDAVNDWRGTAGGKNARESTQKYWLPDINSKRVSDLFVVLITEDRAIPYGIVTQRAMYGLQKVTDKK